MHEIILHGVKKKCLIIQDGIQDGIQKFAIEC